MEFKHASLLLFIVLLGTGILTFIVIERQKELDEQQAAILQDIGEPIQIETNNPPETKTPAQKLTGDDLSENQYLSKSEDLNGDGIAEEISIQIDGNSFNGTETILTINGLSATSPGGNPQGYFGIVDINTADSEKEVAVSDIGPSSDNTTGFYRWDGKSIQLIGTTQDTYEAITYDGKGGLTALARAMIFDTWFYDDAFTLGTDHLLHRVDQTFYARKNAPTDVTATTALTFQTSPTNTTVSMTLAKGEHATVLGCDNTTWCKLSDLQGNIGWLNATTFDLQTLEGLSFAD